MALALLVTASGGRGWCVRAPS